MFDTILVPYDGSPGSDLALQSGIEVARRTDATIHLVYVVDVADIPVSERERVDEDLNIEDTGRELLTAAAEQVTGEGIDVERALLQGDAATSLLEYAATNAIDLIVVGAHRRGAIERFLQRSVAMQLAQEATIPVLTLPEGSAALDSPVETILLATDGRPGSNRATDLAFDLAGLYTATVRGLYVLNSRFTRSSPLREILERKGEETERELRVRAAQTAAGVEFVGERREGKPAEEIRQAAEDYEVDLVVMGTHGHTGVDRLLMGSVANKVLREATTPVLTARTVEETE